MTAGPLAGGPIEQSRTVLSNPSPQSARSGSSVAPARTPELRIGVRDSGVGGLTVARCIRQAVPDARLLYFADTAHVPYGERSAAEVRHYALSISRFLIEQGADIIVFACNTSSALALEMARDTFDVPVIGTIEPGARAALAATSNGRIGVLATRATVGSGVYSQWVNHFDPAAAVREVACPEFVPLVESERTESTEAAEAAARYLAPLREFGVDTVVLGCTHYPLLIEVLQAAAPDIIFVDPAEAVAKAAAGQAARLTASARDGSRAGKHASDIFFASGTDTGLAHWIAKLLPASKIDLRAGPKYELDFTIDD